MSKKKGGSLASNNVNALMKKDCNISLNKPILVGKDSTSSSIKNYSTVYKTTGGNRKKIKSKKNRLYKTKGGKNKSKSKGGRVLMPLRFFNPNATEEPYSEKYGLKKGGSCPNNEQSVSVLRPVTNYDTSMRGKWGDSIITGAKIPKSPFQDIQDWMHGKTTILTKPESDPSVNNAQLSCNGNSCNSTYPVIHRDGLTGGNDAQPNIDAKDYSIPIMKAGKKSNKSKKKGGGSDWRSTVYSRGSYTAPDMAKSQFRAFNKEAPYVSNKDLANGAAVNTDIPGLTIKSELLSSEGNQPVQAYDGLSVRQFGKGNRKSKKQRRSNRKKGGGSDWKSTVYSRGSYTAPDMSQQQFKGFNKTDPYISNKDLANGAAVNTQIPDLVLSNELLGTGTVESVKGSNELNSLPVKQFGKGKK